MSRVTAVRPHLHSIMQQLARQRSEPDLPLPRLRLDERYAVSGPFKPIQKQPMKNECAVLNGPVVQKKADRPDCLPFGEPPMGWMPKKDVRRVLTALHEEGLQKAAGAPHAYV